MTINEWLELQGAKYGDAVMYAIGDQIGTWTYPNQSLSHGEYRNEKLYRLIDGELKRIDKPVFICTTCGKTGISCGVGWSFHISPNRVVCPDCQKPKKIKIKPCPRCGSKDIYAYMDDEDKDFSIMCLRCRHYGEGDSLKLAADDFVITEYTFTDITNQLEVSDE